LTVHKSFFVAKQRNRMKKYKMWTKLQDVLNNREKHNAMAATEERTNAESQHCSATNLGQQGESSVTLNWNQ